MARELNKREKQDYIYNVLCEFDKYTRKHNLKYVLFYGTLIGAIRHNGFIPWDDDVDVAMDYENYERLCKLAIQNPYLDEEKRFKICMAGDENYAYPIIKVIDVNTELYEPNIKHNFKLGLYIDVFVLDEINEASIKKNKLKRLYTQFNKICIAGDYVTLKFKILGILILPLKLLLNLFGLNYKYWNKKIAIVKKIDSDKVGNVRFPDPELVCIPKEYIKEITYHKFEGGEFPIPVKYDELLTLIYGDYMQVPALEDRVEHSYIATVTK